MLGVYGKVDVVAPTSAPMLAMVARPTVHINFENLQRVREDSTSARLIKNPGPKIFENSAGATLHKCQKLEALCHVMPDFDRELSSEVKDQVFRCCPIIKFARDVYACLTI